MSHSVIIRVCWLIFRAAPCFMYAADIIFTKEENPKVLHPEKNIWSVRACMLSFSQYTSNTPRPTLDMVDAVCYWCRSLLLESEPQGLVVVK